MSDDMKAGSDRIMLERKAYVDLQVTISDLRQQVMDLTEHNQEQAGAYRDATHDRDWLKAQRERERATVEHTVKVCIAILETIAHNAVWTHAQRNAFDELMLIKLRSLLSFHDGDIPF